MDTLSSLKSEVAASTKSINTFINSFIDAKSFVETDAFLRSETDLGRAVGEGVLSGFATVNGNYVAVFALNADVLKGGIGKKNGEKIAKCVISAVSKNRPVIGVIDTVGARFNEGVSALEGYNSIIRAYSIANGQVPIINIVKGNNLGMLSYLPCISDFTIVFDKSVSATTSPLVLSAKEGVDVKKVGGGDLMLKSGIATNLVKDNKELKSVVGKALSFCLNEGKSADDPNRVCKTIKPNMDGKALIAEVFDKDSFLETRSTFAPVVVTGFASVGNIKVGVVLTTSKVEDGRLSPDACVKICEHLNVCENQALPVVFLTDCNGTQQVTAQEPVLMREVANLLYRVNNLQTDAVSVVYGKAVGVAYPAFVAPCDYKVALDGAYIAPLDGEATARLVYDEEIGKAKGKAKDTLIKKLSEGYVQENFSAVKISEDGVTDNVIDPNHLRQYLIAALQVCLGY